MVDQNHLTYISYLFFGLGVFHSGLEIDGKGLSSHAKKAKVVAFGLRQLLIYYARVRIQLWWPQLRLLGCVFDGA